MTRFIGFNTIGQNKKFTLTDKELIKRDLANAFSIRQGELVGVPTYGTIIWSYIFENQLQATEDQILSEVGRVIGMDPRVSLLNADIYPQNNGILLDIEITIVNTTEPERLALFFDQDTKSVNYV